MILKDDKREKAPRRTEAFFYLIDNRVGGRLVFIAPPVLVAWVSATRRF